MNPLFSTFTGRLNTLRGTAALTQDCSLTPKSYQFLEDLEIPTMQPLYACFSLHAFSEASNFVLAQSIQIEIPSLTSAPSHKQAPGQKCTRIIL